MMEIHSDMFQTVFALNHRCDIFIMKKFHIKCQENLLKKYIYQDLKKVCNIESIIVHSMYL